MRDTFDSGFRWVGSTLQDKQQLVAPDGEIVAEIHREGAGEYRYGMKRYVSAVSARAAAVNECMVKRR